MRLRLRGSRAVSERRLACIISPESHSLSRSGSISLPGALPGRAGTVWPAPNLHDQSDIALSRALWLDFASVGTPQPAGLSLLARSCWLQPAGLCLLAQACRLTAGTTGLPQQGFHSWVATTGFPQQGCRCKFGTVVLPQQVCDSSVATAGWAQRGNLKHKASVCNGW